MNDRRTDRQRRVREIVEILEMIAANWGRRGDWVDQSIDLYLSNFDGVPSQYLKAAVRHLISVGAQQVQIHDVRAALQAVGYTATQAEGCKHCRGTGTREIARHHRERGRKVATVYAGACDCARGRAMQIRPFRDSIKAWERDPATIAIFYTDAQRKTLTYEQRHGRIEPWKAGAKPSAKGWVYPD